MDSFSVTLESSAITVDDLVKIGVYSEEEATTRNARDFTKLLQGEYGATRAGSSMAEMDSEQRQQRHAETMAVLVMAAAPLIDAGLFGSGKQSSGNGKLDNIESKGTTEGFAGSKESARAETTLKPQALMDELANSGVKYTPDNVVAVAKTTDGKLVWLEKGNSSAGLEHIMRHADDFVAKGIPPEQLPNFIIKAVSEGKVVDMQNTRPVYEIVFKGQTQRVAIDVGKNGFIVGVNPKSIK